MSTREECREARITALRARLDRASARKAAREAAERERDAGAKARKLAARMKSTPADSLACWKRPISGDPPVSTILCSACAQLFRSAECFEAHRVHVGTAVERCALAYELGASQWARSAAGVWSFGVQAMRSDDEDRAYHARLNLERLATVRSELEQHFLGESSALHFPARPAHPLPAHPPSAPATDLSQSRMIRNPEPMGYPSTPCAIGEKTRSGNTVISRVFESGKSTSARSSVTGAAVPTKEAA